VFKTKINLNLTSYPKAYLLAKKNKVSHKNYKVNNNGFNKIIKMKI
jgi:hypothetical protein